MIRKNADGVQWLEFELLAGERGLVHGVFLRHGGVSIGAFSSLNAGGRTGDDPDSIAENRSRMLSALNIQNYISRKQVHGNEVALIQDLSETAGDCDAMITQEKKLALMIKHADCQSAVIYDPVHHALASVHAGWRGNVEKYLPRNRAKNEMGVRVKAARPSCWSVSEFRPRPFRIHQLSDRTS